MTAISHSVIRAACGASLIVALQAAPTSAQKTLGIIADDAILADNTSALTVFDADTDTIIGTVFIPRDPLLPSDFSVKDPEIVASEFVGLVGHTTNIESGALWVIDLSSSTPVLSTGTNPIAVSSPATDLALTPDDTFVIAADGTTGFPPQGSAPPVSASNVAARTQVSTFGTVLDNTGVDVCADNSVLIASLNGQAVRKLGVDASGTLSDTGLSVAANLPHNVACAPGGMSVVVVGGSSTSGSNGTLQSFTLPTLTPVDTRTLSAIVGQTAVINPTGDRVFVRSAGGRIDVFAFNPVTGALGSAPLLTITINPFLNANGVTDHFGQDLMAIHPNGTKLYVSEPGAVRVYDANSGSLLTSITGPVINLPQGLVVKILANQPPVCTDVTIAPTTLWPPNHHFVPIEITGATDPDGDPVTLSVTSVFQDEPVNQPGAGAGSTAPDASLLPLSVRSERNGTGNGRVYHVAFTADDGKGGTCSGTAKVCVQHDRGKGSSCTDGGPLFDSLVP